VIGLAATIPATLESFGPRCFSHSSFYQFTFEYGSKLREIGESAFENCDCLKAIRIPDGVEEIPKLCFSDCSWLSDLSFAAGSKLRRIGEAAFSGCIRLQIVPLPGGLDCLDSDWAVGSSLVELRFESGESLRHLIETGQIDNKIKMKLEVAEADRSLDYPGFTAEVFALVPGFVMLHSRP
jgi:hypothetical protein